MKKAKLNRRKFFTILGTGSAVLAMNPVAVMVPVKPQQPEKPATNISDAQKVARNADSMPGAFPGKVVAVKDLRSVEGDVPVEGIAYLMVQKSMLELTGEKKLEKAWKKFVKPGEKIGLKVNPVAGKLLSTSHAVVQSVVKQLTESGIDRKDIVIWDRRAMELIDVGFTAENYPGIEFRGTECQDENGSFIDKDGKLYGERNIDREWYYWADVEGEYDSETMPYMVNGGKFSYFTRIVTREVDKIINIPVLKNAGGSVTNAMKNLAFGSVSNTGRLHEKLWNETCAEVCAFAPIRDKLVLNICDGLRGCFNGGPGANPQFICNYHTMLVSSDPVAMDRIAYDIIASKRIEEGLQKVPVPESLTFLKMAAALGLGVAEREQIDLRSFNLG